MLPDGNLGDSLSYGLPRTEKEDRVDQGGRTRDRGSTRA
jgi:hypothetical protein